MKKPETISDSKIPYLYVGIAAVLVFGFFAMMGYGSPDDRFLIAVKKCHLANARHAIDDGADVNARTRADDIVNDAPAIFFAARDGCKDILELLFAKSVNVNAAVAGKRNYTDWTPLMVASSNGHREIVRQLLEHGADVNQQIPEGEKQGWTAFKFAEEAGQTEIMRLLQDAGAK